MAEKTLKQKLQELSEEPTPFFHSLTPFAAGFTQGFNYEKKRLVSALVNNSEVTKDFINEPNSKKGRLIASLFYLPFQKTQNII